MFIFSIILQLPKFWLEVGFKDFSALPTLGDLFQIYEREK